MGNIESRAQSGQWLLGLIAAIFLALPGQAPLAKGVVIEPGRLTTMEVRLLAVADGDSLTVLDGLGHRLRVRIAGIDAPESGQSFARAAREHLRALAGDGRLQLARIKVDGFGRIVGRVAHEGRDLGLAQIEAGMAWHFKRYRGDLPPALFDTYAHAQTAARLARRGLWQQDDPQAPWRYRESGRMRVGASACWRIVS